MNGTAHVSCIKYRNLNNISHYHNDHELIYINEGCADIAVNEKIFHLEPKECLFIHSNDIHHIRSDKSTVITVLKAENKYFEPIFVSKRLIYPKLSEELKTEDILNSVGAELKSCMENSGKMSDSLATQLFITMLRNNKTVHDEDSEAHRPSQTATYYEICRKISSEYSTITFKDAAEYMHFSEPYFSKIFHNIFGMTFTQYLNTVRIAAAIEKLKQGNMSITEISADCGFNTIRNFNKVFKKFTGYSPNTLPSDYVFLYNLHEGCGLDPTLNCTEILEYGNK